jgi:HEAT repeat protein
MPTRKFSLVSVLLLCLITSSLFSYFEEKDKNYLFYLMNRGDAVSSLSYYQDLRLSTSSHDFDAIEQMALLLLQQGSKDPDAVVQQLTMLGAGLASSSNTLNILQKGINSKDIQTQLMALNFLGQLSDDSIDDVLIKAMSSDYFVTRMEAAYIMAMRKHRCACGQVEALMQKLPPEFMPYFPIFFAILATPQSINTLKHLLTDQNPFVRVETLLCIANFSLDNLTSDVRRHLLFTPIAEQEIAAYALGKLHDSSSLSNLKKLVKCGSANVRIAAALALYSIGDIDSKSVIEDLAQNEKNIFAIASLGEIEGSNEILVSMLYSNDITVRINAAIALLKLKDARCCPILLEVLITDIKDIILQPMFSCGRSIMCWKVVPSSSQRIKDKTIDFSVTLHIREIILKQALDLAPEDFLFLANKILQYKQNDLVPLLVTLLENLQTTQAIDLLKRYSQQVGAPLIRDYCNLSLLRLNEEGDYEKYVINWVLKQNHIDLIRMRPMLPLHSRLNDNTYSLTTEETSRLLIEMFTTLSQKHDERIIDILIEAIKEGDAKNRYALAGILLRAIE